MTNPELLHLMVILAVFINFFAGIFAIFKKTRAIGLGIFSLGWLGSMAAFVINWQICGQPPFGNMFHVMVFLGCCFLPCYLILKFRDKLAWTLPYFCLMASFSMVGALFKHSDEIWLRPPVLHSPWFVPHVFAYMLSYCLAGVAFLLTVSSILKKLLQRFLTSCQTILATPLEELSLLKMFFYKTLKLITDFYSSIMTFLSKSKNLVLRIYFFLISHFAKFIHFKITNIEHIHDNASYQVMLLSIPFMTFGLFSGSLWAEEAWGRYWAWDIKEIWSLITWMLYMIYFHCRKNPKLKQFTTPTQILAFLALITTFILVNVMKLGASSMHSYGR